jgi:hypothetical protein
LDSQKMSKMKFKETQIGCWEASKIEKLQTSFPFTLQLSSGC